MNLQDRFIFLFGGTGTVGSHLIKLFEEKNIPYTAPTKNECDLLDDRAIGRLMEFHRHIDPKNIVFINLAAKRTNINTNLNDPVTTYTNTLQMSLNYFAGAHRYGIGKVLSFISSCAYPCHLDLLKEDAIDSGPVHWSISSHGLAKRDIVHLSNFYRRQYGMYSSCLVFNNLFGPWKKENEDTLKVADSVIKKLCDAKHNNFPEVVFWGAGVERREFLFAPDAAAAIVKFLEVNQNTELMNVGQGKDISIRELVELVSDKIGYEGKISWDVSRPRGQLSKLLDNTKMQELLGWTPHTKFSHGLEQTIEWYRKELNK